MTASYDETTRLWDAATGALQTTLEGHTEYVASCAFSSDGTRVVTRSKDETARLWDAATGANLCTYFALAPVCSVVFSPINGSCDIAVSHGHHQILIHSDTARQAPISIKSTN